MRLLGRFFRVWMVFIRRLGDFQARILISVVWILMVLPLGLAARLVSDPLNKRSKLGWQPRKEGMDPSQTSRRQF